MSKITFRADDDLVAELEAFDASKSEVMREALREYLADRSPDPSDESAEATGDSLDAMVEARVDEIVAERVDAVLADRLGGHQAGGAPVGYAPPSRAPQDLNVNISLDGAGVTASDATAETERKTEAANDEAASDGREGAADDAHEEHTCAQCGESVDGDHVYCPNCGEKTTRRVFCDCGDEIRSDWGFCPSCGRRTPAADVLDTRNGSS